MVNCWLEESMEKILGKCDGSQVICFRHKTCLIPFCNELRS